MPPNIITVPQRRVFPLTPENGGREIYRAHIEVSEISVHHEMAEVPDDGLVVVSSAEGRHVSPYWKKIDRFFIGVNPITEDQAQKVIGTRKKFTGEEHRVSDDRLDHPAVYISLHDATAYIKRINDMMARRGEKWRFVLPSHAGREKAARGPVVNVREWMEENHVTADGFPEKVRTHLEYFVTAFEMSARIYTDPKEADFKRILKGKKRLWAWHVYSWDVIPELAWYGQSWADRWSETVSVTEGKKNGYGIGPMRGSILEWSFDELDEKFYEFLCENDKRVFPGNVEKALRGNRCAIVQIGAGNCDASLMNVGFRLAAVPLD